MGKLRPTKQLNQVHSTGNWWRWDSNPVQLALLCSLTLLGGQDGVISGLWEEELSYLLLPLDWGLGPLLLYPRRL